MTAYETSRFGQIQVKDSEVITFSDGLLGFPDCFSWTFMDEDRAAPFRTLQSLDNPELAFVIIAPLIAKPDYQFDVTMDDMKLLSNEKYLQTSTDNLLVYAIVTMAKNIHETTMNFQSPLVINPKTMLGYQFVLTDSKYTTREQLLCSEQ